EAARQRRLAVLREQEEEKMDVERGKRDLLDTLATTDGDAAAITKQAQKIILKKSSARRNLTDTALESNGSANSGLTIRGLKRKVAPVEEKPYDPFGGTDLTPSRYVLQESYDNEWLGNAKKDPRHMAGGYSLPEYYSRTMFEAFSGLGVFIEDEAVARDLPAAPSSIGTAAAAQASGGRIKLENKMELDDVF
ncbi:RNA polymerase II transcription factor B subunit, partial [Lachnellula suecica]